MNEQEKLFDRYMNQKNWLEVLCGEIQTFRSTNLYTLCGPEVLDEYIVTKVLDAERAYSSTLAKKLRNLTDEHQKCKESADG